MGGSANPKRSRVRGAFGIPIHQTIEVSIPSPIGLGKEALLFKAFGDLVGREGLFGVDFPLSGLVHAPIWKPPPTNPEWGICDFGSLCLWFRGVHKQPAETHVGFVCFVYLMIVAIRKPKIWLFLSVLPLIGLPLQRIHGVVPLVFPILYCVRPKAQVYPRPA